jgi:probable phosphoglycerate mutase
MHFGVAEGRRLAELPVRQAVAFRADPVAGAFPGAEDPHAAAARGVAALRAAAERHDGRRILVVSHSTLLRLALCELLGIPLSRYRVVFPTLPNCAPAELRVDGPDTALLTYNVPV